MKKLYIKNYLKLFANLNKDNINDFDDLVTNDIIFSDPFNNVKGLNNFKKFFIICLIMLNSQDLLL